ncbi:MAG TPA: excinuclease ABC subunit UvrC [Stellaceae bacterium]|nr:excinuclease ABC subunit UvrC [Stellaceae bacterium]
MSDASDADDQIDRAAPPAGNLARGVAVIRAALKTMPPAPGVYRMLDAKGDALYVGKASNLKNRVANYANVNGLPVRLKRMVAETHSLEIAITHTEVEALLLECNLIKRLMPRYNVLLRDDKSFPYIHLTGGHPFPQLTKHRGARGPEGDYFGPFASAGAVNRTLIALQRAFLLRSCADSVFAARTRPCLLYQIKRCSAPCTGRIDHDGYARLVAEARGFLAGRSQEVQARLAKHMQGLSDRREYESAAVIRDRIRALTQVQGRQDINLDGLGDADVVALHQAGGNSSIQVFFFRGGQNWGNRAYFPAHARDLEAGDVMGAFLGQFYDNKPPPPQILVSHRPTEASLLAEALGARAGRRIEIVAPERGDKRKLVEHALLNAREALGRRLAESTAQRRLLEGVAETFGLEAPPQRIEVYDNSHIQGAHAVGAMIVAGPEGFIKNAYRKFTIREPAAPGDDYAMMREVLSRRFARALKESPDRSGLPDLVLIDGGQGQLTAACQVLADLGVNDVPVVGVAKGPDRNAGRERFFRTGKPPLSLDPKDPVLYFLQRLRDEAHRFAIGAHRSKRLRAIGASPLDEIAGIGAARKRALLHHFGSARAVATAGLTDLERVAGISKIVAKKIYDHFHAEG